MPLLGATRQGDATLDHFQVFGERRTGTNFLHHLIEANLPLTGTTKYGWKHGFPTMPCIADTGLIAGIVREPYAWLSSLHNRPFAISHQGLSFSDFIRTEWYDAFIPKNFGFNRWGYGGMVRAGGVANQADRHPLTGKRFANPLEMRTVKNQGFAGFLERECNAILVDYDTVRADPAGVLSAIAARFDLHLGTVDVPGRVGAEGTPKPRVDREGISAEDRAYIHDALDTAFEASLGYDLTR